ncbi:MAG: hypothetical protein ACRDKY_04960 [Solirubrobacteraceae bacterium]
MCATIARIRFRGNLPRDEALVFVAGQVDAAPHELLAYGARRRRAAITFSSP